MEDNAVISLVSNIVIPGILHAAYDIGLTSITHENIERVYDACNTGDYIAAYSDPTYVESVNTAEDPLSVAVRTHQPQTQTSSNTFLQFFHSYHHKHWKIFPSDRVAALHYPTRFLHEMPDKPRAYSLVTSLAILIEDEEGKQWAEMYNIERSQNDRIVELERSLEEYDDADPLPPLPDEAEMGDLQNRIHALVDLNEEQKKQHEAELEDLQSNIRSLIALNKEQKKQHEAELDDLRNNIRSHTTVSESVKSEVDDLRNNIRALTELNESLKKEVTRLKHETKDMIPESSLASASALADELKRERDTLRELLAEERSQVELREGEKNSIQNQLDKCQVDQKIIINRNLYLQRAFDDLKTESQEQVLRLKADSAKKQEAQRIKFQTLGKELADKANKKVASMRAEITELKSQNQTAVDRIAELNRINEGRLNDVQEKDKTIESLKQSLSEASNANTKLKNDLESVQSSIAESKDIDSRTTRDDDFQNMLTENMRLNDLLLSNGIDPDDLDEE